MFASPVLGRKIIKNIRFKERQLLASPGQAVATTRNLSTGRTCRRTAIVNVTVGQGYGESIQVQITVQ